MVFYRSMMNLLEESIVYATVMYQGKVRKFKGVPFVKLGYNDVLANVYSVSRTGFGTVSAKALLARAMNAAVAKRTPGPKRSQIQPPSSA